jgi:putative membrane protein
LEEQKETQTGKPRAEAGDRGSIGRCGSRQHEGRRGRFCRLREARNWERVRLTKVAEQYLRLYDVAEWRTELPAELKGLITDAELQKVLATKNRATHLLAAQSRALSELAARGETTDLRFIELQRTIAGLYDAQGRAERIKNFPYPRQFSTLNTYFIWLLSVSLPFALLPELEKMGRGYAWLCIPLASTVSWIFHMIDKIGEASENPFSGGPNDVPITSLSRTIEIDLRELLGETPPPPMQPKNLISM